MPSKETNASRNFGIDVLRGLAILFVVIHHLALKFRLPLGPSGFGELFGRRIVAAVSFNGYESVFVFFVISGFLIAGRALDEHGTLAKIDWRRFYARRAARILPLLLGLLAVLAALHALRVPQYIVEEHGQSLGGALLSALGLHLNWYEGRTGWLPPNWDVLWSLSIEELFYLAFPIACLGFPRKALVAGLLLLALSLPWTRAALTGNEIWQEKATLPGMSAIAIGVLSAMLARARAPSRRQAGVLLIAAELMLIALFIDGDLLWPWLGESMLLVQSATVGLALIALHHLAPVPQHGLRWLASMGRLSYEIYLSHMFIVLPVVAAYRWALPDNLYWTFLVYPPTLWLCFALGSGIERKLGRPAALWLRWRGQLAADRT
ncbi:acyltransferase family protein [Niveibacterium terrae]|uniref:acyltransferase family protein n=1 Tax=Niveibacterium terrae TaxID=3373598 RepID=UPI003A8E75BA